MKADMVEGLHLPEDARDIPWGGGKDGKVSRIENDSVAKICFSSILTVEQETTIFKSIEEKENMEEYSLFLNILSFSLFSFQSNFKTLWKINTEKM